MESTTIFRTDAAEIIAKKIMQTANLEDYVVLCIGSSDVVSDSLGPQIGSLLTSRPGTRVMIYGTNDVNVNAGNLSTALDFVRDMHPDKKIFVVDAAVGDSTEVGCVQLIEGGIVPGAATNRVLPRVGDISLIGVVSMRGAKNFYASHFDRVSLVKKMAEVIANSIAKAAGNTETA